MLRNNIRLVAVALLLLACGSGLGRAETVERQAPSSGVLSLLPLPKTTDHSITLDGRTLQFHAKAGTLSLLGANGNVTAEVFYVAYTVQPDEGLSQQRPLTFVFLSLIHI